MGGSPAMVEEAQELARRQATEQVALSVFDIHEDNWDSWMFFMTVCTQWIWREIGLSESIRAGLCASRLEASARMQGILSPRRQRKLFADMKTIEGAVLEAEQKMRQQLKE